MTCTAAAICALLDISGTHVTLGPTDHPRAVAEVVMRNSLTNGPHDNGTHAMAWDGLTVWVRFDWDAGHFGADRLTVTPPDGMICEPMDCAMTVDEMGQGVVYILEWEGM